MAKWRCSLEDLKSQQIIRLSKSCLTDAEKNSVMGVLDREYLGMGAEVELFEKKLSAFFGRPSICVMNGTAALHLALQAAGIGEGDEVLVQSLTYVASFQAISAAGATPIACEVNPLTMTLDLTDAEMRLSSKTKAVMPVHYSGGVGNLDEIYAFAEKNDLRVIEDAAHAFGTIYKGQRIGAIGDITCFSFDGVKNITSGEGGCVVTNDTKVSDYIKDARLLGVKKDSENRFSGKRSWTYEVCFQGWRYHMSNLMAAIGIEQLKHFPVMAKKRQYLAKKYDELLSQYEKIQPLVRDYSEVVPHIYVVRIIGMMNRESIQKKLLELGIQTGVHYQPNHSLNYYHQGDDAQPLENTNEIYPELLTLPLHPDLSEKNINYVVRELVKVIN